LKKSKKIRKNYYKNHKVHQKNTKTNLEIGLDYVLSVTFIQETLAKTDKKIFKRTKATKKYKICNTLDKKNHKIPNP